MSSLRDRRLLDLVFFTRSSLLDKLEQDQLWLGALTPGGPQQVISLEEMTPDHRRHLIRWLEQRAYSLKEAETWAMVTGPGPRGDAATDCFEAAYDELERTSPEDWLESKPLMRKLRELGKNDCRD